MTPKEKAEQLLSHYNSILIDEISHGGARGYASYKCALIAVDEIIKSQPSFPMAWNLGIEINGLVDNAIFPFNYWKEVKQEIEKL